MASNPRLIASNPNVTVEGRAALRIIERLRQAGYEAYFAGGCVRDLLLGCTPKDYDVATSARPDVVLGLFERTFAVGAHFGVVLVAEELEPGQETVTEVATFRNDGSYSDGRHPDAVQFSDSAREDVLRRDFTINGMLLDPLKGNPLGEVLDYVNGQKDLAAGIVRAIGDPAARFGEDKLRMLRAVRFAARFGFRLEEGTRAAIHQYAKQIQQVSKERVRDELTRMLTEGHARQAFEFLDETGLLGKVLPAVARMKGVAQPPQFHPEGDVWTHTLLLLEGLKAGVSPELAWGVLLHDVGKPATYRVAPDRIRFDGHAEVGTKMASEICREMRFSNEASEQIESLVANHMRFSDVKRMKTATLKRFFRLNRFPEHLELHRLDASASWGNLDNYLFAKEQFEGMKEEAVRPPLLVTGRELIAAGYRPGPKFKEILHFVEDAQLEGRIHTTEEGLELVRRQYPLERN